MDTPESVKQMNLTESERKERKKGGSKGEGGERGERNEGREREKDRGRRDWLDQFSKPIRVTASKENHQLIDIQV